MTGRETQEQPSKFLINKTSILIQIWDKLEIVKYEKEISIHAASQKTGREYVNGFKLNRN